MIIGLIGCGVQGRAILRFLLSMKVEIKVFETNLEIRTDLRHHYPRIVAESLDDLKIADGIIVATPSSTHREVIKEVLMWNIALFIEKPLTTTLADAFYLKEYVHDKVFLMHLWRYHGGIQLLRKLARENTLGKITALYCTRCQWITPTAAVSIFWGSLPHDLSIVLEILGYLPASQSVAVEWHQKNAAGLTAILGINPFVQIKISDRHPQAYQEIRLHGTEGVAIWAGDNTENLNVYYGNHTSSSGPVRHRQLPFDTTSPLRLELEHIIAYLKGGDSPISDFKEGLQAVEILAQLETMAIEVYK